MRVKIDSEQRRGMKGNSVKEKEGKSYVIIYRAVDADEFHFNPMDYVTLNRKFAHEHAQHEAVVDDQDQHVLTALVKGSEVFEAPNPGEYFYDGPRIKAKRNIGKVYKTHNLEEDMSNHTNIKETLKQMSKSFFPYAKKRLGFDVDPKIFLRNDSQNAVNPLGKTAYYDPQSYKIVLYITGRHPKDVLRSLSHELVHHAQNCRGEFTNSLPAGEGYAQEDEHLRNMEREAYEQGNLIIRDWEDSIKKQESIMESDTKKIEKEVSDAKANRGDKTTEKVKKDITDTLNKRNAGLNDELMRRWGFNKKKEE